MTPMRIHATPLAVAIALLACGPLAAGAAAAEATLEGYGGDGAVLTGLGDGDSPFGDRAQRSGAADSSGGGSRGAGSTGGGSTGTGTGSAGGGGESGAAGDGNLVLESGPLPTGGPTRPDAQAPRSGGQRQPDRPSRPASPPARAEEASADSASGPSSLPFSDLELATLLAAALGLIALSVAMRRLVVAQPRI